MTDFLNGVEGSPSGPAPTRPWRQPGVPVPYHVRLERFFRELTIRYGDTVKFVRMFFGEDDQMQAAIRDVKTGRVRLIDVNLDGSIGE